MNNIYFVEANLNVQVKLLENYKFLKHSLDGDVPQLTKGSFGSSGYDLIACIENPIELWPNETKIIGTGIAIYIGDSNWEAQIRPRSGKGSKGLVIGNLIGTIDSDYQGELKICAWNRSENKIKILPGEAIAQLVFCPVGHPRFKIVDDFLTTTERNSKGFGSTDKSLNIDETNNNNF